MNRFLKHVPVAYVLIWGLLNGQTLVDLRTQSKGVDFTRAMYTKPFKSGTALPLSCGLSETFFVTTAPAGKNLYACTSPNTWTLQNGSTLPDMTGRANQLLGNDGTQAVWRGLGGDVSGAPLTLVVNGLQGRTLSATAPTDGQVLLWNNTLQDWEPGTIAVSSGGGGGGSGAGGNFSKTFTNASGLTIAGTEHSFGTANLLVDCYDNATPANRVETDSVTVDGSNFNIVVGFSGAQSGRCVVNGSGGAQPVAMGGDVSGMSGSATVVRIRNQPLANTSPADGQVLTWNAGTGMWTPAAPQGGSVSGSSDFNPLALTYTNSTNLTIGGSCTVIVPCNVRFGNTTYSFATSPAVTVQSGSGTVFFYVANNGLIIAASSNVAFTCAAPCTAINGASGFPPNVIPLATWTANNGLWDAAGGHDNRAFLASKALSTGAGIVLVESGPQSTIAVDAAVVPTYIAGSAFLTFPSVASGMCSSELTIALAGANAGDSVAPGWPPTISQGVLGMMCVSAAGIVAVRMCNFSGAPVVPLADTYRATVVRSL